MFRILLLTYSLLYLLGLVTYLPMLLLLRNRKGKKTALLPRLRPPSADPKESGRIRVWIQAVSVGEVNAIRPVVEALRRIPSVDIVLSTTTPSGQEQARRVFREDVRIFYFPLDLGWICSRFISSLAPDLILLVETEIWPNFLVTAGNRGVPVVLVNGRLSDRSTQRYLRLKTLFSPLVNQLAHACMQSKQDKRRILQFGLPEEKVSWVGNLKFDHPRPSSEEKRALKNACLNLLRPDRMGIIWLCGSTKPGEEELLAQVFSDLRPRHPQLRLLIAPRHPHRAEEVQTILQRHALRTRLRSRLEAPEEPGQPVEALILDSIGELAHLYEIADLVFIGGSLVPQGGQNPIEAAVWGKPIIFGPDMSNFREIAATFVESYSAIQVASVEELAARLEALLQDSHAREWLGRNARKVILQNQGAASRTLEILRPLLGAVGRDGKGQGDST